MEEIIQALTNKINTEQKRLSALSHDETGCTNPDRYDNNMKRLQETISTLRRIRQEVEDLILL